MKSMLSKRQGQHSSSVTAPPLPPPPPQLPQAFGHGAPASYQFQYSNCSGRRKALLVGINYFGQSNQLRGCINDVTQMSIFLNEVYGYRREDMVILTDDQQHPMSQPTKANIIRAMHWLVKDAMPNDSLFIHFSGNYTPVRTSQYKYSLEIQDMVVEHPISMEMRTMVSTDVDRTEFRKEKKKILTK
jgi:hypothetical protein